MNKNTGRKRAIYIGKSLGGIFTIGGGIRYGQTGFVEELNDRNSQPDRLVSFYPDGFTKLAETYFLRLNELSFPLHEDW